MRILMWDVHGGYTDSLVAGTHDYLFLPRDLGSRAAVPMLAARRLRPVAAGLHVTAALHQAMRTR